MRRSLRAICRATLCSHSRGTAAIEAAIILPLVILLLTALFDLGYAAYESMQVQAAAEAGAQYSTLNAWNPTAIAAAVTAATATAGITATPAPTEFCGCPAGNALTHVTCTSTCSSGATPGTYAQVNAQVQHWTILPYPGMPRPLTITGTAYRRLP